MIKRWQLWTVQSDFGEFLGSGCGNPLTVYSAGLNQGDRNLMPLTFCLVSLELGYECLGASISFLVCWTSISLTLKRVIHLIHVQNSTNRGVLETRGNRQYGYDIQTDSSKNGNATFDAIIDSGVDVRFNYRKGTLFEIEIY